MQGTDARFEVEIDGKSEILALPNMAGTFRVGDTIVLHVNPDYHEDFIWEGLLYSPVDRGTLVATAAIAVFGVALIAFALIP